MLINSSKWLADPDPPPTPKIQCDLWNQWRYQDFKLNLHNLFFFPQIQQYHRNFGRVMFVYLGFHSSQAHWAPNKDED